MSEPLAYSPKDAAAATGVAYTRLRMAIDSGELAVTYPSPKRMVIRREALIAWLDSLPTEKATA
jgi:hypothetical protein